MATETKTPGSPPTRGMNNTESQNAKTLRKLGFNTFWQGGYFWAMHPKLVGQYCLATAADKAAEDLKHSPLNQQEK